METKFNSRYGNHRNFFKNKKYKTDTEISNKIWKLEKQNKNIHTSWKILRIHQSPNTTTK